MSPQKSQSKDRSERPSTVKRDQNEYIDAFAQERRFSECSKMGKKYDIIISGVGGGYRERRSKG